MKVAIITDLHFGARSDSLIFDNYFRRFYEEVFFPYLDENGITTVFDLGDTFDRRKYINFNILRNCRKYYFDQLAQRNIQLHMLAGNHDTYFKGTNEVNSIDLLLNEYDNITQYIEPKTIEIDKTKIAMLPWICTGNFKDSMQFIEETPATILFGHLEIAGFAMHKGSFSDHGFQKDLFKKFDIVASGHFHHKSSDGNIMYLGAPYEMTWSDFDDPRGFHVFDTDTREFEYHQNPLTIFKKVYYTDAGKTIQDQIYPPDNLADSYVKVVVREKNNPYWFDIFLDKVNEQSPASVQVIEDVTNLDVDDDLLQKCDDTRSLLKQYCEQMDVNVDKKKLAKILDDLYLEAMDQG